MSLSRRSFVRTIGLGGAGLSTALVIGRGREAMAFEGGTVQPLQPPDDGVIHIDSNENARGPGQSSIEALHRAISPRVGRGYPPDYVGDLSKTIAAHYNVATDRVIIGTGSGPILEAGVRAFCSASKPLVTASPSYASPEGAARRIGAQVKAIPVDRDLKLDLNAMAEAATGAGLVFFCNPNNPTATAHNFAAVEKFVRRVKQESPDTAILIDEAYIDYTLRSGGQDGHPADAGIAWRVRGAHLLEGAWHGRSAPGIRGGSGGDGASGFAGLEPGQHEHADRGRRHHVAQGHRAHGGRAQGKRARA